MNYPKKCNYSVQSVLAFILHNLFFRSFYTISSFVHAVQSFFSSYCTISFFVHAIQSILSFMKHNQFFRSFYPTSSFIHYAISSFIQLSEGFPINEYKIMKAAGESQSESFRQIVLSPLHQRTAHTPLHTVPQPPGY